MENVPAPRSASPYEFMFSWGIGFSVAYSLLIYALQLPTASETGTSDSGNDLCYYFFRAGSRLTDALHLAGASPVSTAAVARQEDHWADVGRELTFLISALYLTFAVVLILQLLRRTQVCSVMMDRLLGPATLSAVPICYLVVLGMTKKASINVPIFGEVGITAGLTVLLTEIVILSALLLKNQDSEKLPWLFPTLLTIHLLLWASILRQGLGVISISGLCLLPCTLPISALACWAHRSRRRSPPKNGWHSGAPYQWNVAAALVCFTF